MIWKKLLVIGDSNVQFGWSKEGTWLSLLADLLQRKCDIICRGFSGYNTHYIKLMLSDIMKEFQIDSISGIIILLGSNDSARENSIQHVSLKKYKENLDFIFNYLTCEWGIEKQKIIIISPPKIDDQKWKNYTLQMNYEMNHFDGLVKSYANECVNFAKQNQLLHLDLYYKMDAQGDAFKQLLNDGLHFSTAGSLFLFENLKPLVNRLTENINVNYPYWRDIDPMNPNLNQIDY
jgi:lysophospholipase L1-like esterase